MNEAQAEEKVEGEEAHKFRQVKSVKDQERHYSSVLGFPVAVRPMLDEGTKSWTTIIAEEEFEEEKVQQPTDQVFLKSASNFYEWDSFLHQVLLLPFNTYWQVIVVVSIAFNYFYTTYKYSFMVVVQEENEAGLLYEAAITDLIYLIDFAIALTHCYWKSLRLYMHVRRRCKLAIMVDILSLAPTDYVYYFCFPNSVTSKNMLLARSPSFLRLYRITNYFMEWANRAEGTHWDMFIIRYVFNLVLLLHSMVCLWFSLGCIENCYNVKSWTLLLETFDINANTTTKWYFISFYFSLSTISNTGFGDIVPTNLVEHITCIFAMMCGFNLTIGYYIGSLTILKTNAGRRRGLFVNLLWAIKRHLTDIKLQSKRLKLILKYYEMLWIKRKGVTKADAFQLLPLSLQMEVCFDISVTVFDNSLLFRRKEEPFLRKLSLLMKSVFYLPGETIFHQNVAKYKMICIMSGVVEILSAEDDESPVISFTTGTVLGEISLVLTVPAKATVRAATYTELQVLHKADFFRMMVNFPDIHKMIKREIGTRIRAAYSQHVSEDKSQILLKLFVSRSKVKTPIRAVKDTLRATQATTPDQTALEEVDKLKKPYFSLYKISENISHEEEENVCYSSIFPWILQPDSHLTMFWDTAVFIVVVLVSIMYPYCIAYTRVFPRWMNNLSIGFDVVYFMDIVVRSITAIRKNNILICNWKEICSEQMTILSFYLDVFAVFPIEVAAVLSDEKDVRERVYSALKLNRLLKAWKIPAYFIKLERNLWVNVLLLCCCKYILCLIIISIWVGSVMYMEACFFDPCDENNWFAVKVETQIGKQNKYPCFDNPEVMSVYFAFTLLSRSGFGDILPESSLDMIFSCFFLMVGLIIYGYCIAELCATHLEMERSRTEYQEAMFAIIKFMAGNKMSKNIQDRVINYFRLQWEYNKGVKVMGSADLLADAALEMQQEVLIKERVETLRDIPLFTDVDKDFLQLIAMSCRTQLLPSYEIITYAGDLSREMYIIQEGYCEVISGKTGMVERSVGPKHYFGDLEMLYGIPRIVSVRSVTHCKVISIEYSAYAQAVSMFTKVLDENQQVMQDSELLKSIKKLSSRKRIYPDNISLLKRGIKTHNIHYYKTLFVEHFKGSFKYVPDECKKLGEDYSAPFRSLKKFFFVKCLILPWCILPQGKFLKYWYSMRALTAFIVTLYCPYQESKSDVYTDDALLTIILDIIAYIDLYVMLHVGYYNEKGILVIHPKCTSKYYLTHSFPLDLIACFPFGQCLRLLSGSWSENSVKVTHLEGIKVDIGYVNLLHTVLRLNRTLQIYRLSAEIHAIESNILRQSNYVRILKFFPYIILFLNMWASLIVALSCRTVPSSFMNSSSAQAHTHIHLTTEHEVMACEEGCWLDDSHFQNSTNILELYTVAFYWITSTFMGIGIGDIAAQSGSGMVVDMSIIIFGSLMFAYMCASLGSSKASLENTLSQYQEMITELLDFMEQEFVNEDLQRRIIDHFEYEWKRRAGVQPYKIFTKLHSSLMQDAMLEMYERTLREVPLFENVEQSFLQIIGTHLQESYFLRGETVVRSQDVQTDIFIIFRGKVEVLSKYNEMIACMGPGGMFGNIGSVSATICSVTITASRNLDVLTLPSSTFYSVLNKYPNMKRKMDTILSTVKDYIVPTTIIESDESLDDSSSTLHSGSITSRITSLGNSVILNRASVATGGTFGTIATYTSIIIPPHWFQFAILPESSIYTVLSFSVLISSYLSFMLVSYLFAFQDYNMPIVIFSFSLDVIFYFKIYLELHQAYFDRYGEYVIDIRKIRFHYLKNKYKLFLDIIANLPLAIFCLAAPYGKRMKIMSILRLTNLFRLGYVVLFYRSRSNLLMTNKLYLRISTVFTCLTAYTHCLACIWYLIGCPLSQCSDYSWAYYAGLRSTTPACESYAISLYFVVSLFTRTGYGDIQPHNFFEMLVTSAMMIISMFINAIFIADITLMLRTSQSTLHNYEYGITELRDSLRNQSVSSHQMDKVWNYVRELWRQERGKQMPRLILWAPTVLKSEMMNAVYSHHLRNSYIFANTDEDFLRQLAVKLKHCVFFEGNYIVQHGDTDQNMYFIHRGEVSILTVHGNLTETIHDVLKTGDMFGVAQGLYHGLPHHFSFRAKSVVDIVILNLDSWYHMLKYFPKSKDIIYSRAGNIYMNV